MCCGTLGDVVYYSLEFPPSVVELFEITARVELGCERLEVFVDLGDDGLEEEDAGGADAVPQIGVVQRLVEMAVLAEHGIVVLCHFECSILPCGRDVGREVLVLGFNAKQATHDHFGVGYDMSLDIMAQLQNLPYEWHQASSRVSSI